MSTLNDLVEQVQKIEHGFLDIKKAADKVVEEHKNKELIKIELQKWDKADKRVAQIYKLASRFL